MIKRFFIFTITTSFVILYADEKYVNILKSIDKDLEKYEKIATKTKENIHFQPTIISVLNAKTLKNLGLTNLKDALQIIPGIELTADNINYKTAIFRGSNPTSFGQSKLFIDGVLVNNIYFDGYSEYLDMPIDLIKRIEVIRGAGNKSNTTASYVGSINVITYANNSNIQKNKVFVKIGTNGYSLAGFTKHYKSKELTIFTDFYYQKDDETVSTKSNGLKSGIFNFPGIDNTTLSKGKKVFLWYKNFSFGMSLFYKNFYLLSRIYNYKQNPAFGLNYIQAQKNDTLNLPNHYLTLGFKKEVQNLSIDSKIGINFNSAEADSKVVSDGVTLPKISNPSQTVTFQNGMHSINIAKQKTFYHESIFKYKGLKKHTITTSYRIEKSYTYKVVSKITNRNTGIGLVDYSDTIPFFDKNALRKTIHLSIKDKYSLNQNFQLLSYLSYENNTHIKAKLEPKFALIYHKNTNIFKFSYSSSHRTPSWQELYTINNYARRGNKNLKAEKIDTLELSYIKQYSINHFFSASFFNIKNKNQIHNLTANNQYVNSNKTNIINGLELEYKGNISPRDTIYANMSYIDGDNSYDKRLVGASKILAKAYYIYNIKENLLFSTVLKYSSKKDRLKKDKRAPTKANTLVDTALIYKNFHKKYQFSISIKNLFNKHTTYLSKINTYQDDYPKIGRKIILSYSKEF